MNKLRFPIVRVALFAVALALAVVFVGREADSPAEATSYNPSFNVSVSDPTPGAAADLMIQFSVDAPDAFPNVRTDSTIQFIPKQWGIHAPAGTNGNAPIGAFAGTFNALSTIGILGYSQCSNPVPVPFKMYEASTDTSRLTSALDLGGDVHPGGLGYSGQFAQDPDTFAVPGDLGQLLIDFNDDEMYNGYPSGPGAYSDFGSMVYKDVDGDGYVSVGDIRLIMADVGYMSEWEHYPAGSVVQPDDWDVTRKVWVLNNFTGELHSDLDGNTTMDPGEVVYRDLDGDRHVSYGDQRISKFSTLGRPSTVEDLALNAGITRYPDFLTEMFPPDVVGEPLARQWGAQNVLDFTMVSLNLVTFRPGQLPGYPASLGYPTVVVLFDPLAPIDLVSINMTSDLCTPLTLISTNFGVSQDNPATVADESGYVRLTNPNGQKDHVFTMVSTSQPDADDDGVENMLDTCPFDPNVFDDGHTPEPSGSDMDGLDDACDPGPGLRGPDSAAAPRDEDQDSYANRGDNCSVTANGVEDYEWGGQGVPGFFFYWAIPGDQVGAVNQVDTDGDDIGDACEGSEHGAQCLNDVDDDGDGFVNDGCPRGDGEGGDQCLNSDDDDDDRFINDGCPTVVGTAESGDQCLNDSDDDDDGIVNEGCPQVVGVAESGDQCLNDEDDDDDGVVNEGCPTVSNAESGDQCNEAPGEALDDDDDGRVNDGCPRVVVVGEPETGDQCLNDKDDDDDGKVNDGCPANGVAESGWRCNNALDDEAPWQGGPDGYVNDGCPTDETLQERGAQCLNDEDDDDDGFVNDGCPFFPSPNQERGDDCRNNVDDDFDGSVNDGCPYGQGSDGGCNNNVDDDGDGYVNDGCPAGEGPEAGSACGMMERADSDNDGYVNDGCPQSIGYRPWIPILGIVESGAECENALDDDNDSRVNDGCPSVDAAGERFVINGHMHVVTLTEDVSIYKHGIKLNNLGGPKKVQAGGAKTYSVPVSNLSDTSEDIQVALRVLEDDCATVNGAPGENTAVVSVGPGGSGSASFTVDWAECPDYEYTLQADACHAGDEDAGFFGVGDCPGTSDGMVDPNPLDDAPRSKIVTVGSP